MQAPRFVTLENLIIDTFTRIEPDGTEHPIDRPEEIGGAGTYALIGARIFLPPQRVGMIVDFTPDSFPLAFKRKLEEYGADAFVLRERFDGHPTIRSVNRYKGQVRIFEYLSKPIFLYPRDLADTELSRPSTIHFVPLVDRLEPVLDQVDRLLGPKPLIVWEPDIPACVPDNFELFRRATPRTDVISPNHTEVLSFLGVTPPKDPVLLKEALSHACLQLSALKPRIGAIIRCGAIGCCYVGTGDVHSDRLNDGETVKWVPAYWDASVEAERDKVVDPTGAGNSFLGGVSAALDQGKDLATAVLWGTVSASFVIEQNGLPSISRAKGGDELWNGERPSERLAKLQTRVSSGSL